MVKIIHVDLGEDKEVKSWGSSPISPNSVKISVDENHEFFNDNPFLYRYTNRQLIKDSKLEELFQLQQEQAQLKQQALSQEGRIEALESAILELIGGN